MYFSFDEVYHRIGAWWNRSTPHFGKSMDINSPGSFHRMGIAEFPVKPKDEPDETKLLRFAFRLNNHCLRTIRYESF